MGSTSVSLVALAADGRLRYDFQPVPADPEAADERDRRRQEKIQAAERAVAEADQSAASANAAEQDLEHTVRQLKPSSPTPASGSPTPDGSPTGPSPGSGGQTANLAGSRE